jgi:hypothetical protein
VQQARPLDPATERGTLASKAEPALLPQDIESAAKRASEDLGEGAHGEQEQGPPPSLRERDPAPTIDTQPATGDHAVEMDVLGESLPPGVQDGGDAELGTEVLGISGELLQGSSGGAEEQVIEPARVDADQGAQGVRQGEDDVEVRHRQEQRLLRHQPLGSLGALTLRAVAIAAGVIGDVLGPTVFALLHVPTQGRRPTALDGAEDAPLLHRDVVARTKAGAAAADHARHLESWPTGLRLCRRRR